MNKMGAGKTGSRGGKDFYIVLVLCAAVLGTAGWIAVKGTGTDVEEAAEIIRVVETETVNESEEETVAVMAQAETETETPAVVSAVLYSSPVEGAVQKPYSSQTLMYDATMHDWRVHEGVDYACADGTSVAAAADGVVTGVDNDPLLGTTVTVTHADGMETLYSNLAETPYVSVGDSVSRGQIIGCVGSTAIGESEEACHLHFAMRCSGVWKDPEEYIA